MRKKQIQRQSFSHIQSVIEIPDLLEIQLSSFESFIQIKVPPEERKKIGLQAVFENIFPITDNREELILEFDRYSIDMPKYTVEDCQERGVTYAATLKATLRLSRKEDQINGSTFGNTIESEVYLGSLPMMTEQGTFVINGAERVVVSQLHRSPGVFFSESIHPNGTKIYSSRIIPFRGSWVEFTTDINDVLYVYIDRGKKFPVTTLLRAIGFPTNYDILNLFGYIDDIFLSRKEIERYFGRTFACDIIDEETGELLAEEKAEFDEEMLMKLKKAKIKRIALLKVRKRDPGYDIIINTLKRDRSKTAADALESMYRELRGGDPPDVETARKLINRLFFDEKRYDLGEVGRYRINKKLQLNIDPAITTLTIEDLVSIIKRLLVLRKEKEVTDDIDHLGNRRIRTVGEQLANQFSIALSRMARTIKERMNLRDTENLTPQELVNVRTISSVINTFFGTNQLSQFMDQVNPLTELTHKRRLSALGPGGLTRERAGFEVRDVHYTHYGRLCPIETPEGPNIGLISSLCTYARINRMGFVETPYRKVKREKSDFHPKVTKQIIFLSADEEDRFCIAQANAPLDEEGRFIRDKIKCRVKGEFPVFGPEKVDLMDVSPNQIVSIAAALIPFLEHDDANRALMGSNMQRQAVPLLLPEVPIVGTGMEAKAAMDSRTLVIAEEAGTVIKATADKIVVRPRRKNSSTVVDEFIEDRVYHLRKFVRTNQDTCTIQKPIVQEGEYIRKEQILADGCATENGELALGRNILVAFMPWYGYNFEDSIIVSERLVQEDVLTSIHIEELELQVRETKRGEEELTREIPNVSEEATKDLDENGIIRVGAEVHPGDIIIGKVTPKGETDLTPEDKLLKAIFGDKAGDMKDASLKAPPGLNGIVIGSKLFSRKKRDSGSAKEEKAILDKLESQFKNEIEQLKRTRLNELVRVLEGRVSHGIHDQSVREVIIPEGIKFTRELLMDLDLDDLESNFEWSGDQETDELVELIFDKYRSQREEIENGYRNERHRLQVGDELPSGIVQLAKVYVAKKRKVSVGDKMAGRHGNKGVVGKIVPIEDMPFMEDGTPIDIILNPLGVPSRMNLGQIFETMLGYAGFKLDKRYATPVFDGATSEDIQKELTEAGIPIECKANLYDGLNGEKFDQKVTVGYIYMMKLSHLVDDKIHARSIGPYSLITQQPLGGKAQFGGQRFGEMEVWALEAYGAAHILQEILTVKSDDVNGRARTYEAIVKGENLPTPGVPESFNVLINELQGLGLNVSLD
ncbi:MAG: DNA-directed RNA polymerase subunit beta [candidate division Zixibacteria bacterium]|nr:DNA-directed RNA polymerase subunit beta [Candidatus Tariuqbacter arcticus]